MWRRMQNFIDASFGCTTNLESIRASSYEPKFYPDVQNQIKQEH